MEIEPIESSTTTTEISTVETTTTTTTLEETAIVEETAEATDTVTLSAEALEAAEANEPLSIEALGEKLLAATGQLQALTQELQDLGADETAVGNTLSEETQALNEKVTKTNEQAVTDYLSGNINDEEYVTIRLQSAIEQVEGINSVLGKIRDDLKASAEASAPVEIEAPEADLTENVSANINGNGVANGKVEEKAEETGGYYSAKAAALARAAEEKDNEKSFEKVESNGVGPGKVGLGILKKFEDIEDSLAKLVGNRGQGSFGNGGQGNGSLFGALNKFSGNLERLETILEKAMEDKKNAESRGLKLSFTAEELLERALGDDQRKKELGTVIQRTGFGYGVAGFGGAAPAGGPVIHSRNESDGERSGILAGSASGIGMGQFTGRANKDANTPSLMSAFGGVRNISGAVSRSKLSVVA